MEYPIFNGTAKLVLDEAKKTSKIVMNEGEAEPQTMKLKDKLKSRKG